MDSPDFPAGAAAKSPRTLHGPRPAPLRLRKDSHKIRKPPVPPPQHHHHHHPPQIQPPYRPPVIIYTVSPKVIHTNPNEFMNLVQRLTGPHASAAASPIAPSFRDHGGAVSPAARFASLEKAARSPDGRKVPQNGDVAVVEGVEINTASGGYFPGILSPGPASLPPIPPNFFSPLANDQNQLGFFQDLSPGFDHNNNTRNYNYFEGGNNNSYFNGNNNSSSSFIMASPSSNLLLSPYFVSPTTLDLFNTLFD